MTEIRYVGLDIHKRHVMVAAVNAQQKMMLRPTKVSVLEFPAWSQRHLYSTDHVALEATTNAWTFHDQLAPLVARVAVANANKIKLITSSASKTDRHDALILAKLLAANLLPGVWVPPQHVRELRTLTQHRMQLIYDRNAAKNRLHSLLHQYNLTLPDGNPFSAGNEAWWTALSLSPVERLQVRHEWCMLHTLSTLIDETEAAIAQLSVAPAWEEEMTFLMQLSGVGLYTGMTILAAIGDIQRFPSPEQLVGHAGLGARVHDSGDTHRSGKISKQGRTELRTALVACAWSAVRWSDY